MNGGLSQQSRVLVGLYKDRLPRSHFFKAYRLDAAEAREIDVSKAQSLEEAVETAKVSCSFKSTLIIHEIDDGRGRGTQHAYTIRRKAAVWRKNQQTGMPERFSPLWADWCFSLPVDAFVPTAPFDAFRDDPVGIDRTLVEGQP